MDAIRLQDFRKFKEHVQHAPQFYMERSQDSAMDRPYFRTLLCYGGTHQKPTDEFLTFLALKKFIDLDARTEQCLPLFLMACWHGSIQHLALLIEAGCAIQYPHRVVDAFGMVARRIYNKHL